jgi:hypothetical protein
MANQYDLTPTLSQYLDRHMVSQLLDFAQERKVRLRDGAQFAGDSSACVWHADSSLRGPRN